MARKRASTDEPSTRKKSSPAKGSSAAKAGAASDAPPRKKPRKPAKPPAGPKGGSPPVGLGRWLRRELLVWSLAVGTGLGVAGAVLWARARADVETYLASPPRSVPGTVWSAPMEVRVGQHVTVSSLVGDLLAAGYDRVPTVPSEPPPGDGAGLFAVVDDRVEVWTEPLSGPGFEVPRGRVELTIEDDVVVHASVPAPVFRPTVLASVGQLEDRRAPVQLGDLSPWVEPALLSMEDARFRSHHGVDPIGVARAVGSNLLGGRVQGGSTITQQLAKNLFLGPERTLRRKVREAFFAAALESALSKDRLLELYLREVYLGQMGGLPIHGVEQAARAWFGKSAARLELHEAAAIVGVIPAPNAYSPVRHPEVSLERRDLVLHKMEALGAIDPEQARAARSMPLGLAGVAPSRVRRAPYAVDAAADEVDEALGHGVLATHGYQVYTAIQPALQRAAEEAVADGMAELDADYPKAAGAQVALVAVRVRDGGVVAMVGGRSYAESAYNRALDARRQAGSTVKPLTLLAALEDGRTSPADTIADAPISRRIDGKPWTPTNYDGRYLGDITVRQAIEGSRNIPAVLMAESVGASRLQRFLRDAGLSEATNLPSAALGSFGVTPLEVAGAYALFPGGGRMHRPALVRAVTTADGVVALSPPDEVVTLAGPRAARQASSILEGVLVRGTGQHASELGVTPPAGGKTGTTDDYRDAWFVGFTPELAIAVWVGRDKGTLGLAGSRAALPTWAYFVLASGTLGAPEPKLPDELVVTRLCADSGLLARDECEHVVDELLTRDRVPGKKCDLHGGPTVSPVRAIGRLFGRKDEDDR